MEGQCQCPAAGGHTAQVGITSSAWLGFHGSGTPCVRATLGSQTTQVHIKRVVLKLDMRLHVHPVDVVWYLAGNVQHGCECYSTIGKGCLTSPDATARA